MKYPYVISYNSNIYYYYQHNTKEKPSVEIFKEMSSKQLKEYIIFFGKNSFLSIKRG